jgi:hypothetical protein
MTIGSATLAVFFIDSKLKKFYIFNTYGANL